MEIPFLVLMGIVTPFIVILLGLGYIYRTSFPMSFMWFLSGAILLLIFLGHDNITLGQLQTNQTYNNVTDTIINTYEGDNYAIKVFDNNTQTYTPEPTFIGMMLIVLALSFIMVGILIEKFN